MLKRLIAFLPLFVSAAALCAAPIAAQSPIRYEIDFTNRAHHEAVVTVRIADLEPGPVELRMSRTSPGRYALHEFAKNVYGFAATGRGGQALPVTRPDLHQWTVTDHGGELVATYTLFGDRADGTYTGIDETHAHLNIPATFVFARGLAERPVEVRFKLPAGSGWKVATQLTPTSDPEVFTAPDLAYFMDSPTELSAFDLHEWTVAGPNGPATIRAALHHEDPPAAVASWVAATRRIAAEEAAVFGEFPAWEGGTYTFLACYLPWVSGDGMEHRNSTSLTAQATMERSLGQVLSTVAHELFHTWNMERIRGAGLEPFDFEEAVMSEELWFGEGVTNYYTGLTLERAGVTTVEEFARRTGATVDAIVNGPGRRFFSPVEMSMQAPFVDAAVSVDPTNRANTFLSYYTYGEFVGLALDLTLRARPDGRTLDDFMRAVWVKHGRTEIPYSVADLEVALADYTGDAAFARDFFAWYVTGREVPDMAALLARAGIRLHPAYPDMVYLTRARLTLVEGGLRVDGPTLAGEPLYRSGLDRGDLITRVNGVAIDTVGALERGLAGKRAGDAVEVEWTSRGGERRGSVTLGVHPTLTATPEEVVAGGTLTPAQRAFRDRWLAPRAGAGR